VCEGVERCPYLFRNIMKQKGFKFSLNKRKKRKGVHSKNASKGQNAYKKIYKGQGR
tara:strand:- start:988 stop:1155 length:168 start_codon:yes stop_codon:yes gene_type:complete